jgi:hypothetical protein
VLNVAELAARLDAETEHDADAPGDGESADADYDHFARVLLDFGVDIAPVDIAAIIEGGDTAAAASSVAVSEAPFATPAPHAELAVLPPLLLATPAPSAVLPPPAHAVPPFAPPSSPSQFSPPPLAVQVPHAGLLPFTPSPPAPLFSPDVSLARPLPWLVSPAGAPHFLPQCALHPPLVVATPPLQPPVFPLPTFFPFAFPPLSPFGAPPLFAAAHTAPLFPPPLLPPPAAPPAPPRERERDRTPPLVRAASPPRRDNIGRALQPRGDHYYTKRYISDNLHEATSIMLAAIKRLERPVRALRTDVPWHNPAAFEALCDQHVPGFFAQLVRLLTPSRDVPSARPRARRLAPLLLLDLLAKRSERQSALPKLRARALAFAHTSRTGMEVLHTLREVPAVSTIYYDSLARAEQAPALINSIEQQHAACAHVLVADDFHYCSTSRAPTVPATSRPFHFRSSWLRFLPEGTSANSRIADDALFALASSPVVRPAEVVPFAMARLRTAGAFGPGPMLSLLANRSDLVNTQQQSLTTTGTWSTDAVRLASGGGGGLGDAALAYSVEQRSPELAHGLCPLFTPGGLHSATDGWQFISSVFDPALREPLVRHAMTHGVFVPGDNPAMLQATAAAVRARELYVAGKATPGAADRNLAISNLIPKIGELHAQLGTAKAVVKHYRPIVEVLWRDVFHGRRALPKSPRPERLMRVLTVGLASWMIDRDQLLPVLAHSLDVQDRYLYEFFEVHAPLAVMLYVCVCVCVFFFFFFW